VGDRLQNFRVEFHTKPLILDKCNLTSLIIKNDHRETLHGGINVMRNYIHRKFWIFGLENSLKQYEKECLKFARYRQITAEQIMVNLPTQRITLNTGVNYAGPYHIRCSTNRNQKSYKGYTPGSGGEGSGVSERVSGVSGQQRWSQAERCLARGRFDLHHNILNPFRPAGGLPEEPKRTWRVRKGQWSQRSAKVVPGRALPRPRKIHPAP